MKKNLKIIWLMATAFTLNVSTIVAQDLPRPSPLAKVEQRIGLTDVSVTYSRPGVKERTIWGELVPYDEKWRTGANAATVLTFSHDVKVNGKDLTAGSYAFYTKPTKAEWTVYFNTETKSWGTSGYKTENDALTLTVKPEVNEMVESMRFTLENIKDNSADLVLAWEKIKIVLKIEVEFEKKAMENIEKAIEDASGKWRVLRSAANYCADNNTNLDKGMEWINESIELHESWYSYWVKADVQAAFGNKKEAIASAKKAIKLGEADAEKKDKEFTYRKQLDKAIEGWK
ncbi:MAG: DUF2911 domain-containing protein [Cytophagales bacterium]|nr:DUF2911 domain-containing protein [Cytophagales bacterium]